LISDDTLHGVAQLLALGLGVIVGRKAKSPALVWLASFCACFAMMTAMILYDGQGACLAFIFMPVVYFFATVGRDTFRADR
jgi:hypothetical protein